MFDEAHEARGGSSYSRILKFVFDAHETVRPRLLALSATPLVGNTSFSAVEEMVRTFRAKIYSPFFDPTFSTPQNSQIVKKKICDVTQTADEVKCHKFILQSIDKLANVHPIIASAWEACLGTRYLDVASGVIRDLKETAHMESDNLTFLMAKYLEKWMDALEVLRISGPRVLLANIKDHYEQADYDDDELTQYLRSFRAFLGTTINELISVVTQKESTSLDALLVCVRSFISKPENQKMIVFVTRRKTAIRLCRRLCSERDLKNKLNPYYILGSRAGYSMEQQRDVLRKFRDGRCRLLVATSMLEQGLDVDSCGLVVCFDGVRSLTALIQCRGRARNTDSEFAIFTSNTGSVQTVQDKEDELNDHVSLAMKQQTACSPTGVSKEILDKLAARQQKYLEQEEESNDRKREIFDDENSLILKFSGAEMEKITEEVCDAAAEADIPHRMSPTCEGVFAFTCADNELFMDRLSKMVSSQCWVSIAHPLVPCPTLVLRFDTLSTFHYLSKYSVSLDSKPIWNEGYELHINGSMVHLINDVESMCKKSFRLDISDLIGEILVHNSSERGFNLFLSLRRPPVFADNGIKAPYDFDSRSFNLALHAVDLPKGARWDLRCTLRNFNADVFDTPNMTFEENVENQKEAERNFHKEYLVQVWRSKHAHVLPNPLPASVLDQIHRYSLEELQSALQLFVPRRYLPLQLPSSDQIENHYFSEILMSKNYRMIRSVSITPYRTIVLPASPVCLNRVVRNFGNPDDYLLVTIADEHGRNPWSEKTKNHFQTILYDGVRIADRVFRFLGCSNSQLREGHCWLTCLNVQKIHSRIGSFEGMEPERKHTRLAMAFSSSTETVAVSQEVLEKVEDDITSGEICFSEGIGKISEPFRQEITSLMNLRIPVSAFQIRVGGIKGVVCVFDQPQDIIFRKSMKKFSAANFLNLEVLAYSRPLGMFLNRQVILCLSSLGVPDSTFLDLSKKALYNCLSILFDPIKSIKFLKNADNFFDFGMFPLELVSEPLFRRVLFRCALKHVRNIVKYARVHVPGARVLMGVLDETGTLEYGQVYVHISEETMNEELDGPVAVFRNPVVFPSDVRVLHAVRDVNPRIRQLYVNCVVFPSRGPDSHAAECSGGDLDGDLFSVVWDAQLIPPIPAPGLPVPTKKTCKISSDSHLDEIPAMVNFFCDYASKWQLGILGNAHLVLADKLGLKHPDCIELAHYVVAETDEPKKGYSVSGFPPRFYPKKYPDFMCKDDKTTYKSTSVLGIMFRQCFPVLETLIESDRVQIPIIWYGIGGGQIEKFYSEYVTQLRRILEVFELDTEADLFSGIPFKSSVSKHKHEEQLRVVVQQHGQDFWSRWKGIYRDWVSSLDPDSKSDAVSDWYNFPRKINKSYPAYSFSWLAIGDLDLAGSSDIPLEEKITQSLAMWVRANKIDWISDLSRRSEVAQVMGRSFQKTYQLYGSSLFGFAEDKSDINLCFSFMNGDQKPNTLEIKVEGFTLAILLQRGERMADLIPEKLDCHPSMWICLKALTQWARAVSIVKSRGDPGIMPLVCFVWIYIFYLERGDEDHEQRQDAPAPSNNISRWTKWLTIPRTKGWGADVLHFLSFLGDVENAPWIAAQVDPVSREPLIKEDLIPELATKALVAVTQLSLHEGHIEKLFETSKVRLFVIGYCKSSNNLLLQEQYLRHIRQMCDPHNELELKFLERTGKLFLQVSGNPKLFASVERCLRSMFWQLRALRLQSPTAYHVCGSTFILLENGAGQNTRVRFVTHKGQGNYQHINSIRRRIQPIVDEPNPLWKLEGKTRFMDIITEQLYKHSAFVENHREIQNRFFGELLFTIRTGSNYLVNVPGMIDNTFDTINLGNVEDIIQNHEEAFINEEEENIETLDRIQKLYNPELKVLKKRQVETSPAIKLVQLSQIAMRGATNRCFSLPDDSKSRIRTSFFPSWRYSVEAAEKFAQMHGFQETSEPPFKIDLYHTISLMWQGRELVLRLNSKGCLNTLRYRTTRWVSASIIGNNEDVRIYVESLAEVEKESPLIAVIAVYKENSVLTSMDSKLTENPLIEGIFEWDWIIHSMRRIQNVKTFKNDHGAYITLNKVSGGVFDPDSHLFGPCPNVFEFELMQPMEKIYSESIYDLGIALYDYMATLPLLDTI